MSLLKPLLAILLISAPMAACNTIPTPSAAVASQARIDAAKGMYTAEAAFSASQLSVEQAIKSGALHGDPATKALLALASAHSYLMGARQAYRIGDMIGVQLQISLATSAMKGAQP